MNKNKIDPQRITFYGGKNQVASKNVVATLNALHFDIETNKFKMFLIGSKLIAKSFIKYALRFEKDPIVDIVIHFVITLSFLMLLSISLVHFIK